MSAAPDWSGEEAPSLVDLLLEEQQSLSAVERFSEKHDADELPLQARYYQDLIPSAKPGSGEQYAFRVDLDACTGCKACVTACHNLNGLDADETWRDVGALVSDVADEPFLQTVTTACHHCEDPGCLSGCPVKAYEKDPDTGIVRHLDDQCIGCQYCVLKCPYDVPKYSPSRGIVRKCDMCAGRLETGEAPACVQGCPNGAISIEIVTQGVSRPPRLLPVAADGMPESNYTRPTTRYVGRRPRAGALRPADFDVVEPAEAHTPLAVMLVALQLSVGALLFDRLLGLFAPPETTAALRPLWAGTAAALGLAGQGAAMFHLGRPLYAWRAFLGWRTSWMSREILVFGGFAGLVVAYAASLWLEPLATALGAPLEAVAHLFGTGALATGLLGTFCSVMVYADTHREFWAFRRTAGRFFGSLLVLGPPALLATGLVAGLLWRVPSPDAVTVALCVLTVFGSGTKLLGELHALRPLKHAELTTLKRSASLVVGPLRPIWLARLGFGIVGGLLLPWLVLASGTGLFAAGAALATLCGVLAGEQLERHLFFRAEASRAMPRQA